MGPRPSPHALDLYAVFAALPAATAVFAADSPHFTLLAASDALCVELGRPRDALLGLPVARVFPPASPDAVHGTGPTDLQASLDACLQTGLPQPMQRQRWHRQRPDGAWETRCWDAVQVPVRDPGGSVSAVLYQATAVIVEDAAATADPGAQRLIERTSDAHCVLDREFRIVGVNAAAERLLGRPRDTLLGRSHWDAFPASVDAPVGRAYRRVVAEGVEQHLSHHYTGEGYDLHIELDAYPTDAGGVAMFWRDVTERARAEAALRRSEEQREMALEAAHLGTFVWDLGTDRTEADPRMLTLLGRQAAGLSLRDAIATLIHPDDAPGYLAATAAAIRPDGTRLFREDVRMRRDDGDDGGWRWLSITGKTDFDAAGTPLRMVGTALDVTDRKHIEATLQASEARLRAVLEQAPLAIAFTGPSGEILFRNGMFDTLWGRPAQATTARTYSEAYVGYHLDGRPVASEEWPGARAVLNGEVVQDEVYELVQADGRTILCGFAAAPIRDAAGAIAGGVVLFRDVTENRRMQQALRRSEEKYRALFNEMDEAYAVVEVIADDAGRWSDFLFLEVNPGFMRHTGMPDPVGRTATDLLGTPNPRWAELYGRAADTGVPVRLQETELQLGRTFDLNIFRLGGEGSRRVAVLFNDITERLGAERALAESERRHRLLFENIGEGFALAEMIWDADGRPVDWRYLEVNDAWTQTGISVSQTVGRTAREVDPAIETDWIETYAQVVRTGQPVSYESYAAGIGKWLHTLAFKHSQNCFGLLLRDVTARKEADATLQAGARRQAYLLKLADALRPLADPAAIQGEAVRVLGEHLGSDRVYYVEVDEARAEYVVEREWHRGGVSSHARRYPLAAWPMPWLADGRPWVVRDVAIEPGLPDEQRASYREHAIGACVVVPLLKDGRLVATLVANETVPRDWTQADVWLLEDTAERTWAAVERARVEESLRASHRRKDEFLAMLGHELRNPLAPIRMVSELLDRKLGDRSDILPLLGILARQTSQLVRLVDDLLDVARLTHGRVALKLETVEMGAVVDQAIETVRMMATEKSQQLRLHRCADELHVSGDRARLVQVVTNVLHNAIKYTDPGGTITVAVDTEGPVVVVSVHDTGIGISADLLPLVFDLFVQGERSLDRAQGGLGIGLSVARHLVALHGGALEARSAGPGQGSTFVIRLPRMPAPDAPQDAIGTSHASRRILVVDDNADAADSVALLLRLEGHAVDAVYNAADALEQVARRRPDVVLLDIGMPQMDGYAAARILRERHGSALRLVAMTGYGQAEDRERSRAAGFDAHLVKPVDMKALRLQLDA